MAGNKTVNDRRRMCKATLMADSHHWPIEGETDASPLGQFGCPPLRMATNGSTSGTINYRSGQMRIPF